MRVGVFFSGAEEEPCSAFSARAVFSAVRGGQICQCEKGNFLRTVFG